jgi:hypothetical protein
MTPLIVEGAMMNMKRIGKVLLTMASGLVLLLVVLHIHTDMFQ